MKDHVILLGWFLVTAVINYLLRTKTAEQWEELAQRSPRYAAFAKMLRAIGLDPVKLLQSLVDFVRGESQKRLGPSAEGDAKACEEAKTEASCEAQAAESQEQEGKDSK